MSTTGRITGLEAKTQAVISEEVTATGSTNTRASSTAAQETTADQSNPRKPRIMQWKTLHGHTKAISVIKFSPDGKLLASASGDHTIRIWKVETGECIAILQGFHRLGVNDVAWSPDSRYLVSASDDTFLALWEIETARPIRLFKGHTNHVLCVAFHPRGNTFASGSADESVIIWNAIGGEVVAQLDAHSEPVTGIAYCPDGTVLATVALDGLCRIWDCASRACLRTLLRPRPPRERGAAATSSASASSAASAAAAASVDFAPGGRYLLVGYVDSRTYMWDLLGSKLRPLKIYTGLHVCKTYCLPTRFCTQATPPTVVQASEDGTVCGYNLQNGEPVVRVRVQRGSKLAPVIAMDVSPRSVVVPDSELLHFQTASAYASSSGNARDDQEPDIGHVDKDGHSGSDITERSPLDRTRRYVWATGETIESPAIRLWVSRAGDWNALGTRGADKRAASPASATTKVTPTEVSTSSSSTLSSTSIDNTVAQTSCSPSSNSSSVGTNASSEDAMQ